MHKRLIAAIAVLIFAVAGLGAAMVVRNASEPQVTSPTSRPTSSASPTSPSTFEATNLLVTVVDTDKKTAVASVQGVNSINRGVSSMGVPVGLSVDIDSNGEPSTLSRYTAPEIGSATYQVGNQMGILMEGGWSLERVAFVALVDSVGGITIGKNPGTLTGKEAAKYVLDTKAPKASVRTDKRFATVWRKMLAKLSDDQGRLMSVLTSLGATSQRTMGVADLASLLQMFKRSASLKGTKQDILPTTVVGRGTPFRSVVLRVDQAVPKIVNTYPRTQLTPWIEDAKPRVRVRFGGTSTSQLLALKNSVFESGSTFVWGGPLREGVSLPKTVRIYVSSEYNLKIVGEPLANAFNVPVESVKVNRDRALGVQASVVAS